MGKKSLFDTVSAGTRPNKKLNFKMEEYPFELECENCNNKESKPNVLICNAYKKKDHEFKIWRCSECKSCYVMECIRHLDDLSILFKTVDQR